MIFSTKNSNYKEEVGFDTKDLSQLEDIKNRITFTDAFSTSSNDLIINGELVIENEEAFLDCSLDNTNISSGTACHIHEAITNEQIVEMLVEADMKDKILSNTDIFNNLIKEAGIKILGEICKILTDTVYKGIGVLYNSESHKIAGTVKSIVFNQMSNDTTMAPDTIINKKIIFDQIVFKNYSDGRLYLFTLRKPYAVDNENILDAITFETKAIINHIVYNNIADQDIPTYLDKQLFANKENASNNMLSIINNYNKAENQIEEFDL